jgi:hypothetical protein
MYDAADRRFMAADPIDGTPNKPFTFVQYAYASNNPLNRVDLFGLWDDKVHLRKTQDWVNQVIPSISTDDVMLIAKSDNNVDIIPATCPFLLTPDNQSWHFNINDCKWGSVGDSRMQHYHEEYDKALRLLNDSQSVFSIENMRQKNIKDLKTPINRRSKKNNSSELALFFRNQALIAFGKGLHPLQDIYAHQDWDSFKDLLHFAYYDEKYYKKLSCNDEHWYFTASDGDYKVFDDPQYDLSIQKRARRVIRARVSPDPIIIVQDVYVATKANGEYGKRYNDTMIATYKALEKFKVHLNNLDCFIEQVS